MSDHGGTYIPPAPARLVVSVGGASLGGWADRQPALDRWSLADLLDADAARREADRQARRDEIGAGIARAKAAVATSARRDEELRAQRQGAASRLGDETAAIEAVASRRRGVVAELASAADEVVAAIGGWQATLEQHGAAEAALASVVERVEDGHAPEDPERTAAEMTEGQAVLLRTESARRRAVGSALDRLHAAHSAAVADTEPLQLAGVSRLRHAVARSAEASEIEAIEQRRRSEEVEIEALGAALAGLDHPDSPEQGDVVLATLAALPGDQVVVDDALAGLDDGTVAAVLAGLAECFERRQLVYLTDDVRVLSWAIGLPSHIGGVAGAVEHTSRHE